MLITRWNEAFWALPVLTLKSNYLDRWPNDCTEPPRPRVCGDHMQGMV